MEEEYVKFPFTEGRPADYSSYPKMIQSQFFPNFKVKSVTTILITINIIVFLVMHLIYQSGKFINFLQWPHQMDPMLLDVEKVKHSRIYFYQTITSIFMNNSYIYLSGNIIFSFFVMYEMENSWRPSISMGILAGFLANCMAIITLEGRFIGFSVVLVSYVGMIISMVLLHWKYLQQRMGPTFCAFIVVLIIFVFIMIGLGSSILIDLYGFIFGMILAAAFYPRLMESGISDVLDKIFKIVAVCLGIAVIVLAIII